MKKELIIDLDKIQIEKVKNYIKTNYLILIVILMLGYDIFLQRKVLKQVENSDYLFELNQIQDDINDIKDRLDIL